MQGGKPPYPLSISAYVGMLNGYNLVSAYFADLGGEDTMFDDLKILKKRIDELYEKAEYTEDSAEYSRIVEEDRHNADIQKVLLGNYKHMVMVSVYPRIAEIWNAYAGKGFVGKTREKVVEEICNIRNDAYLHSIIFNGHYDNRVDGLTFSVDYKMDKWSCDYLGWTLYNIDMVDVNKKMLQIPTKADCSNYPYITDDEMEEFIRQFYEDCKAIEIQELKLKAMQMQKKAKYPMFYK